MWARECDDTNSTTKIKGTESRTVTKMNITSLRTRISTVEGGKGTREGWKVAAEPYANINDIDGCFIWFLAGVVDFAGALAPDLFDCRENAPSICPFSVAIWMFHLRATGAASRCHTKTTFKTLRFLDLENGTHS